jgi:hypothetical protein
MTAIETLVLVVVAGVAFIAIASLVVIIIGIHQEERYFTVAHGGPPTGPASLTRRVLGAHFALRADTVFAPTATEFLPDALAGNPPATF